VTLPLLFERLPDLRLGGPPVLARNNFLHTVKHLPVHWAA